jgi:alpha-L-rhamnosidase
VPALLCVVTATCIAAPVHLRINARTNPLGIDTTHPTFSWQSDSTARNWKQSAYEILVASSPEALYQGHADIWDSGKQTSSDSVDIPYTGPTLHSRQRSYWAVRVWDANGAASTATEPALWEMGLLQPNDWQAQWIHHDDQQQLHALAHTKWIWLYGIDAAHAPQGSIVDFRYQLHLDAKPDASVLHVLCGEHFTTTVNGIVTGQKSEWTAFDREDIRSALKWGRGVTGDNTIIVRVELPKSNEATATLPASFAAAIYLRESNATGHWLVTGEGWTARTANTTANWTPAQTLGDLQSRTFGRGADRKTPADAPDRIVSTTSLFRKNFTSHGQVITARLYITALGSYRAYLNGKQIGDSVLTPGFTDFRKRVLYQTYDVTSMVHSGENTLAAILAAGWHGSPLLWSGTRTFPGPDCLRAQFELTYADGSHQTIATNDSWQASNSPTTSATIYGGESYDARLAQPGWNTPRFHPSSQWVPAQIATVSRAIAVTAQPDASVHVQQTLKPISENQIDTGAHKVYVFNMGQNMVGVVKLHVHGPRGTTVRLRFAERLNHDGSIYTANLRNADATDFYTLSGNGDEVWMAAFTFHGFQYVEVSGYPGKPQIADIQGEVLNSLPATPSMRLQTSSNLLNRMDHLGLWGQRGNFISIPTDCPQRDERMGWMGDAGAFWRTGTYNFNIDAFSNKFVQDIRDAQSSDGSFSNISPNIFTGPEAHPGAPGWGDAGILVPYATWLQYGNRTLLEKSWPAMQRWMDFIQQTNPNFLRQKSLGPNYADWLAPDPHTPKDLVATAYWALIAHEMQTMATALGRNEDAEKYAHLYDNIRSAYQKQYIQPDGSLPGNTQTDYVVTLAMGLAPKPLQSDMTDRLVQNIRAHNNHLTTGFLGTPFLLPALDKAGRDDVAYTLLLNTTYPSWGYMVANGATTWWERWNGNTGDPSMNSLNHYAFGSVMAWVFRRVAGIDTDPHDPAFHHILIAPQVNPRLTHVHAEYDSAYGTIITDWNTTPTTRCI